MLSTRTYPRFHYENSSELMYQLSGESSALRPRATKTERSQRRLRDGFGCLANGLRSAPMLRRSSSCRPELCRALIPNTVGHCGSAWAQKKSVLLRAGLVFVSSLDGGAPRVGLSSQPFLRLRGRERCGCEHQILVAQCHRLGLGTYGVSNKVSKITSGHLILLDRAFPEYASQRYDNGTNWGRRVSILANCVLVTQPMKQS